MGLEVIWAEAYHRFVKLAEPVMEELQRQAVKAPEDDEDCLVHVIEATSNDFLLRAFTEAMDDMDAARALAREVAVEGINKGCELPSVGPLPRAYSPMT